MKEKSFRIENSLVIYLPLEVVGELGPVLSSLRVAEKSKIIKGNVSPDIIHSKNSKK